MSRHKVFDELKNSGQLPSPSGVGLRILCLTQDEWEMTDLVGVIQSDPALTGRVIRLANSVQEGAREVVTNVQDASMRLGVRTVVNLALGFTLVSGNRSGRCPAFDYDAFWSNSLARAVTAEFVSRAMRRGNQAEAFTCSLLSRIGELALASVHPAAYAEILDVVSRDRGAEVRALEMERFAIDSREVTMAMMSDWGLPEWFFHSVSLYEHPDGEEQTKDTKTRELISVLRAAAAIATFCTADERTQVELWPSMEAVRFELGLEPGGFASFLADLCAAWAEWGRTLEVEIPSMPPIEHVERLSTSIRARNARLAERDGADESRALRILAVDDETIPLRVLEAHLRKAGHEVMTARNGREALAITLEWNPHIVISDWMMPVMDGLQLCMALRRAKLSGRSIYFLLLTGRDEEERIIEAFESGIDDYVVKPFKPKILLARVRAGLRLVNLREQVEEEKRLQQEANSILSVEKRRFDTLASTDVLTGIPNRRYAMNRLHEEWATWKRKAQALSVVMADIDHFKEVNDGHGHDVGDVVLREVAHVMRRCVRSMDVVARIGGEEFLVVCPDTEMHGALDCAERVRRAVEAHVISVADFKRPVTLSVGVASTEGGPVDVDDLLKRADAAVYEAKQTGRNRVCWQGEPRSLPKSA